MDRIESPRNDLAGKFTPGVPQSLLEAIERGEADLTAGRTCDAAVFLAELEAEDAAWLAARQETSP